MGIRGLTTYIQNNQSNVLVASNLDDYVAHLRKIGELPASPTLLVDGLCVVSSFYSALDWLCQGEWIEYKERLVHFVDRVRALGVEPVFFFDGWFGGQTWIARCKAELLRARDLYKNDSFRKADEPIVPCCVREQTAFLLKFECKCKVVVSLCNVDAVIVEHANDPTSGCIGVLSDDSDFMIFELDAPFMWIAHAENFVATLSFCRFDRLSFCKSIELPDHLLPLLAVFLGNDVLRPEMLDAFHHHFVKEQKASRKGSTPRYDKKAMCELVPKLVAHLVKMFASATRVGEVEKEAAKKFLVERSLPYKKLDPDLIDEAIASYFPAASAASEHAAQLKELGLGDEVAARLIELHTSGENSHHLVNVLVDKEFRQKSLVEAPNLCAISAAVLLRPIRARIYGLLFGSAAFEVDEYCASHDRGVDLIPVGAKVLEGVSISRAFTRPVVASSEDDVDRLALLVRVVLGSDEEEAKRWASRARRDISKDLYAFCLAIRYLHKNGCVDISAGIRKFEIFALIAQACRMKEVDVAVVKGITNAFLFEVDNEKLPSRLVHLAELFGHTLATIHFAICACGQPIAAKRAMPWLCFDGKVFYSAYRFLSDENGRNVELPDRFLQLEGSRSLFAKIRALACD